MGQQFGDTTLRKVFVGGLAWETQKDSLREHFEKYGEILEAVIISDKLTGRSKGYGFVTFKEAEAAGKACEDPTPVINGRRANCNLASLGARRARASPPATPAGIPSPIAGMGAGGARISPTPAAGAPWYYPTGTAPAPASPPYAAGHHHHYPSVLPYYATVYGYSPSYMTELGYNPKLGHATAGGSYVQGQFSYSTAAAHGGVYAPNAMVPVYPMYQFHHQHQAQSIRFPSHIFPPTIMSGGMATIPTIISKPPLAMPPPKTAEAVTGCS